MQYPVRDSEGCSRVCRLNLPMLESGWISVILFSLSAELFPVAAEV